MPHATIESATQPALPTSSQVRTPVGHSIGDDDRDGERDDLMAERMRAFEGRDARMTSHGARALEVQVCACRAFTNDMVVSRRARDRSLKGDVPCLPLTAGTADHLRQHMGIVRASIEVAAQVGDVFAVVTCELRRMRAITAAVLAFGAIVLAGTEAGARPRSDQQPAAERWSVAVGGGIETTPESQFGTRVAGMFGLSGTVRVYRSFCLDARICMSGDSKPHLVSREAVGSDYHGEALVSDARARLDLRAGACPSPSPAFTFLLVAGPAVVASAGRVTGGATVDAGVLVRVGPLLVRLDAEVGVLRYLLLGAFLGIGVAI